MIERLSRVLAVFALLGGTAWAGSMNGVAGSMPAYYDDTLFTINFMELASSGEAANLAHDGSINTIYIYGAYLRKAGGEHEDLLQAHSARGARGNLLRTDIRPAIDCEPFEWVAGSRRNLVPIWVHRHPLECKYLRPHLNSR